MNTIGPDNLELDFQTNIFRSQKLKLGIPLKARLFAIGYLYSIFLYTYCRDVKKRYINNTLCYTLVCTDKKKIGVLHLFSLFSSVLFTFEVK